MLLLSPLLNHCAIYLIDPTQDNPHEAELQGRVALELCWILEHSDLDLEAPLLVEQFQEEQMTHTQIKVLHQICYL
jgi:hypothetical protein